MISRKIPLAPAEGWVTFALVLLMCVVLALAIDDARWVLGRAEYLDMLVYTAIGGVLVGFIGPKVGWGRWLTYLIGAIFAALIVPILTGLVLHPHGAPVHDLYVATADSVVQAWFDLTIRNLAATTQFLHHILTLGLLVWATSMFASYAVFGHHRPLNAVIVVGVVLLGNMALTVNPQLPYLVVFSVASLFLLIRSHVFDEQSEWMRRRIGDPASISSVYLRGGTIFIAVAVLASALLTQTAASAPLAGAWDGVEDGLLSVSRSFSRFLPTGGSSRPIGLTFGSDAQIGQVWNTEPSAGPHDHAQSDRQDAPLLAGRHLRQDRTAGVEHVDDDDDGSGRGCIAVRRARRRRRSGDPPHVRLHGHAGRLPRAGDRSRPRRRSRSTRRPG